MATIIVEDADIFSLDVEALVNPVNCKGVSGAGLAKAFAQKFPTAQRQYVAVCKQSVTAPDATGTTRKVASFQPGDLITVVDINITKIVDEELGPDSLEKLLAARQRVIFFPTKNHWKRPSKYEYIEKGLRALRRLADEDEFKSIAIPALGCGLGGLDAVRVSKMVYDTFSDADLTVHMLHPLTLV